MPAVIQGVLVRVAVAVDADGQWQAVGNKRQREDNRIACAVSGLATPHTVYWLTAVLPVPTLETVRAQVVATEEREGRG